MLKYIKLLSFTTTSYLALFVIDSIFELFKINNSGTVTTFLGLQITTLMTTKKLDTTFSLTWKVLFIYIGFTAIVSLCYVTYVKIWASKKCL